MPTCAAHPAGPPLAATACCGSPAANKPMRKLAAFLGLACQRDPLDATQVIHPLAR